MPADPTVRWAVSIADWVPDPQEWSFLSNLLENSAREEISFYKRKDDQKRALIARLAVRSCIHTTLGLPWGAFEIKRTKGKKPFLSTPTPLSATRPNFNFNISHEGDFVLLASEPLCLCGVDVSAPLEARGRSYTMSAVRESFRDQLAPCEWADVDHAAQSSEESGLARFRCFWSLKEAYVKARGQGLGFELGRAAFTLALDGSMGSATVQIDGQHDPRWAFYVQQLGRGYWAAVARGPPQDAVDAWGEFRATFQNPSPSPSELQAALEAPWPPFSILHISQLIPPAALQNYATAGGELL